MVLDVWWFTGSFCELVLCCLCFCVLIGFWRALCLRPFGLICSTLFDIFLLFYISSYCFIDQKTLYFLSPFYPLCYCSLLYIFLPKASKPVSLNTSSFFSLSSTLLGIKIMFVLYFCSERATLLGNDEIVCLHIMLPLHICPFFQILCFVSFQIFFFDSLGSLVTVWQQVWIFSVWTL